MISLIAEKTVGRRLRSSSVKDSPVSGMITSVASRSLAALRPAGSLLPGSLLAGLPARRIAASMTGSRTLPRSFSARAEILLPWATTSTQGST